MEEGKRRQLTAGCMYAGLDLGRLELGSLPFCVQSGTDTSIVLLMDL